GAILAGRGEISRETEMHLAVYASLPLAGAVFHAHSENIMVFASQCRPIPPTSEQTDKYGPIELVQHAPSHTVELGECVVAALLPGQAALEQPGTACLIPRHGIVCVARDLDTVYDTLERIDRGARMYLLGRLLE